MKTQQTVEQIEESIKSLEELKKTLVEMKDSRSGYCGFHAFMGSEEESRNCSDCNIEEDEVWKPEEGDPFYYIGDDGTLNHTYALEDVGSDDSLSKMGNVFKTKGEAEKYKLRLQSMAYKPYLPKKNEKYFYVAYGLDVFEADFAYWYGDAMDTNLYLLGRIRRTKEEAEEWIEKFSESWSL